jgi:hypothetical protein
MSLVIVVGLPAEPTELYDGQTEQWRELVGESSPEANRRKILRYFVE